MNIKEQSAFLLPYLLFLIAGTYFSLNFSQNELSIYVNSFHHPILDIIFNYITYLGDGFFVVLLGLLLFMKDKKLAITILMAYALSSGLVQLLKHTVFSDFHRPMHFLASYPGIHPVEGVELNYHNSFPSGHSTAAFSLFAVLAFNDSNRLFKMCLVFPAVLVAFSRIYLLQHFLIDTLVGSIIGTGFAALFYYLIIIKEIKFPFK